MGKHVNKIRQYINSHSTFSVFLAFCWIFCIYIFFFINIGEYTKGSVLITYSHLLRAVLLFGITPIFIGYNLNEKG